MTLIGDSCCCLYLGAFYQIFFDQLQYVDFGPATFHLYPAHISDGSALQCAGFHA